MLEHARRSIAEMQSATERIAALRDPDTGRVRLAFLHSLANWYVPEQLRRFRESAPAIGFDLFQGPAHEITQRVLDGQADIAITAPRPQGARASSGAGCTSSGCAWPFRADTGSRAARRCGCRPRRESRSSRSGSRPDCGSSPTNCWRRTTSTPTSCSRRLRSPRWKAWSPRDSGSPSFPVPRDGGSRRVVHVPLTNAGAKREVGLVWDRDRDLPPPAERVLRTSSADDASRRIIECVKTMHWTH